MMHITTRASPQSSTLANNCYLIKHRQLEVQFSALQLEMKQRLRNYNWVAMAGVGLTAGSVVDYLGFRDRTLQEPPVLDLALSCVGIGTIWVAHNYLLPQVADADKRLKETLQKMEQNCRDAKQAGINLPAITF